MAASVTNNPGDLPIGQIPKAGSNSRNSPKADIKVKMVLQCFVLKHPRACTAIPGIQIACRSLQNPRKAWPQHLVLSALQARTEEASASRSVTFDQRVNYAQRSCAAALAAAALILIHPLTAAAQVSLVSAGCTSCLVLAYNRAQGLVDNGHYKIPTVASQVVQAQPQGGHHNHSASPATVSAPSQAQAANAVASIAGLFGFQSPEDDGDTAGPFAVQGQTR